jgi:lipopolysaccharide transport system ATP-binding protein
MNEIAGHGRTVLFVSHNMMSIEELCDRVIWIQEGRIRMSDQPRLVIAEYLKAAVSRTTDRIWDERTSAPGNDSVRLHRACVRPMNGQSTDPINVRTPFVMEFEYWKLQPGNPLSLSLDLLNERNVLLFSVGPGDTRGPEGGSCPMGLYRDSCGVPGDILNNGWYRIGLRVHEDLRPVFRYDDILTFQVWDVPKAKGAWLGEWRGVVRPAVDWRTERIG